MKLEEISTDMRIRGIEPGAEVKVLHIERLGPDAVNITYRRASGPPGEQTLFRVDEARLEEATASLDLSFNADAHDFKLAVEALRIQLAHLFDPMMAVHTADVEPLPHQISAVYEEMLARQPLRFLLADDPGAGKTIMAGLLIRELMLRGDLRRCLVIAPGGLVDQWQTEMNEKFGISFSILSRQLAEQTQSGNPFLEKDMLIARLDQLARNEDWIERLQADGAGWDLIIVDEAHKMSASFFGRELKTTKRYQLGEVLGRVARHLLLMTATPHNGKEEDFRLFMSLIDPDRFLGRVKSTDEKVDATDLMRRMIKEDLLKFDGKKLFPERKAQTLPYHLSPPEQALYEDVTEYVRKEMGRADQLDGKRKGTVGFALTVLQRRLASSPLAIYRSLRRRRERLEEELEAAQAGRARVPATVLDLIDRDPSGGGERLYDYRVRMTGREPEFGGRYLNSSFTTGSCLRPGESDYIFRRSNGRCRILLVYNGISRGDAALAGRAGFDAGRREAATAITAAGHLRVPHNVRIYADLEGWPVSVDWLMGWWEGMYQSRYRGLGGLCGRGGNVDRVLASQNPLQQPGRYRGVWSTVLPEACERGASRRIDDLMRGTATGLDHNCHVWTARPR